VKLSKIKIFLADDED